MSRVKNLSTVPYLQKILEEFQELEDRMDRNDTTNKVVQLKDDPVALACASYRMYLNRSIDRWADFGSIIVTEEDRAQAECLKQYYREQFKEETFKMLKSQRPQEMSPFRRKLYLLSNNDLVITQRDIGLLYRLPYFYHEDLALDRVVQHTESVPEFHSAERRVIDITLFKKVFRSRQQAEIEQYWFTCETDPHAYMLPVKTDNILRNFFDNLASRPMRIEAVVVCKQMQGRPNFLFHQLAGPRLINV